MMKPDELKEIVEYVGSHRPEDAPFDVALEGFTSADDQQRGREIVADYAAAGLSRSLSLLTAWFRLVFVAIVGGALVNLFSVLELLGGADDSMVFEPSQLNAQAMAFLSPYEYGFNVGFIFFGVHIMGLGYLILRSSYIPRLVEILLVIASVGPDR